MGTKIADEDFIAAWQATGSPKQVERITGLTTRQVYKRRIKIEASHGIVLAAWGTKDCTNRNAVNLAKIGARALATIKSGVVIVFSDGHFWPGERSTAFDALIHLINELQPKLIICNGDAFDGARISRFPPTEWAHQPTVKEELDAVRERLAEVEGVAATKANLVWTFGNHDSRYSMRLAQAAPEYVGIEGMDLSDHFPAWENAWSCMINGDTRGGATMVKHRWKGGIYAYANNAKEAGVSMVTGHLHRCQIYRWTDYSGVRWGVDGGTISDFGPDMVKFTTYTEDAPLPWGSGFCILTYDSKGMLLPPELVNVVNDVAYFRGRAISMNGKRALQKAGK